MADQPDQPETVELYENRCAVCHKPFFQKRRGRLRRTCSAACRQKLYLLRKRQAAVKRENAKPVVRQGEGARWATVCPECGAQIEHPARGRKRKTCSNACRKRQWRRENPTCVVCGKQFKRTKGTHNHKYCSERCRNYANSLRGHERRRHQEYAEMLGYRPSWLPERGSGYREEIVPWEDDDEAGAVIREREADPNYEPDEALDPARAAIARELHELEQEQAARAAAEEARKARRLAWDLLEDESRWR